MSSTAPCQATSYLALQSIRLRQFADSLDNDTYTRSVRRLAESSNEVASVLHTVETITLRSGPKPSLALHSRLAPYGKEQDDPLYSPLTLPSPLTRYAGTRSSLGGSGRIPPSLPSPISLPSPLIRQFGRKKSIPDGGLSSIVAESFDTTKSTKLSIVTEKLNTFSRLLNALPAHSKAYQLERSSINGRTEGERTSRFDDLSFVEIRHVGQELKSALLDLLSDMDVESEKTLCHP
jgi:hypothetical protein